MAAPWSLRRRLIASVLALTGVGLVAVGFLTTAALRNYLVDEVDQQLREASAPFAHPGGTPDFDEGPPPRGGFTGPGAYYIGVLDPTGAVVRVVSSPAVDSDNPPDLPAWTLEQVAEAEGVPFTVGSAGPDWRVIAWVLPDESGSIMIAASLGPIQATVTRLVGLQVVIGFLVLAAIAVIGRWLVAKGLQPLTMVQETTAAIAAGRLDERVPFSDPHTEVGALAGSFNTMLDRLQEAFEAQRASESAARQSEERMRRFVADASHELRTPLTTVRGYAELHRMGALATPEQTADAMRRIETESARMGVLVSDLLLLARLDQERAFAADDVDLVDVAEHAVAAAAAAWPGQEFALTAPATAHVTGDADRLHQVITNLLSNAQRYNPSGQPIGVTVSPDGGDVVLAVSDHGPGVPKDMRADIFERFVRADDARSSKDGGAGLGLSIVAAIVAGHDGTIRVEETPGGGATFVVRLPAQW